MVFVLIAIPKRKRQTRFCLANQRLSFGSFEDVFDDAPCDALGMGEWREAQHVAQRGADGLPWALNGTCEDFFWGDDG